MLVITIFIRLALQQLVEANGRIGVFCVLLLGSNEPHNSGSRR